MAISTQAYKALERIVGAKYISEDPVIMQGYKSGPGGYEAGLGYERVMTVLPAAVILPKDTDEVQRIVKICSRYNIPYVPYATGFYGPKTHCHVDDELIIDMKRMQHFEWDEKHMYADIGPGIVYSSLQQEAFNKGCYGVIGGGGAGLSAAIEAADAGTEKIIVLEKMLNTGGTTATAQGMIAGYETKVQKASKDEPITYDAMVANLMNNALWKLDPALTKITVESSGQTIDWLIDRAEVEFQPDALVGYGPLKMMHVVDGFGPSLVEHLTSTAEKAGVEIRTENKAVEILMDENQNVSGVVVETADGTYTIHTKAVILATGGYSYNPELTALLDPEKAGTFGIGHPSNTGDGLIMASNVGAALTHTNHLMAVLKDYEIMKDYNGTSNSANISKFIAQENLVLVGQDAKRFVDEKSGGYMTQLLNEPIFDQMHKEGAEFVWAISDQATIDAAEIKRGENLAFITADTAEELAAKMNLDPAVLKETIDNYNAYAAAGADPEFKRTVMKPLASPYVAVAVVPCEIITYGGVARNENSEVIRADNTVIKGLYAAGEVSANSAYMGFTLSNAVTWGRIAGENASAFVKE